MEGEIGVMWSQDKAHRSPWRPEEAKRTPPLEPLGGALPYPYWNSALEYWLQTSGLPDCCFQSPSLWWFVTIVTRNEYSLIPLMWPGRGPTLGAENRLELARVVEDKRAQGNSHRKEGNTVQYAGCVHLLTPEEQTNGWEDVRPPFQVICISFFLILKVL